MIFPLRNILSVILLQALTPVMLAQQAFLEGQVLDTDSRGLAYVQVQSLSTQAVTFTDDNGNFRLGPMPPGEGLFQFSLNSFDTLKQVIHLQKGRNTVSISLHPISFDLKAVNIEDKPAFALRRLRDVEGVSINAGRKSEVIRMDQLTANLAGNNSRQVFSRITGLNIWESDGAGLQLGIGGRGLNPNRTENFNTRQNGYDISADALGYPESYYTPPMQALEKVEIIRGAASLQFGPQFGGMANFVMKQGPADRRLQLSTAQTLGSFGFFNSFTSLGGTVGKFRYYAFHQYKRGSGWRENSDFEAQTVYGSFNWKLNHRLTLGFEFTHMNYLAQQAGGLSDIEFAQNPRQATRDRNYFAVDWNLASFKLDFRFNDRTQLNMRSFGLMGGRKALGYRRPVTSLDPIYIQNAPTYAMERDLMKGQFRNLGHESRLIHRYALGRHPQTFLIGFRAYRGFNRSQQGNGSRGFDADFAFLHPEELEKSTYEYPSTNLAAFSEHVFRFHKKWSLTPGMRAEYIDTRAEGFFREIVRDLADNIILDERYADNRESQRAFVLGGLGLSYKANQGFECYANLSQNYRSISFNDFREVNPSFQVDPDMQDERGFNADLGVRGQVKDWVSFEATLFWLSYQDRIGVIQRVDPDLFSVYRYRTNISDSYTYGLESYLEFNLLRRRSTPHQPEWKLFSNLALLDSRYVRSDEPAINGNRVEMVPRVVWRTGSRWQWRGFEASLLFSYVGKQFTDATNARQVASAVAGVVPAYQVVDLSLAYQYHWLRLEAGSNNLLDQRYFTRRATGYPGPGIIPADGRSVYVTLQVQL